MQLQVPWCKGIESCLLLHIKTLISPRGHISSNFFINVFYKNSQGWRKTSCSPLISRTWFTQVPSCFQWIMIRLKNTNSTKSIFFLFPRLSLYVGWSANEPPHGDQQINLQWSCNAGSQHHLPLRNTRFFTDWDLIHVYLNEELSPKVCSCSSNKLFLQCR